MRRVLAAALLAALAWPAGAYDTPDHDSVLDVLATVRADRAAVTLLPGRDARQAARQLKTSERLLGKLATRYEQEGGFDAAKLKLFGKAGRALARAAKTGALPPDAPSLTAWNGWFDVARAATEEVLDVAASECDRIIRDKPRGKVLGKLHAAIDNLDAAVTHEVPADRALGMARALARIERVTKRAQKLCRRETKVRAPGGISVYADRLTYSGRTPLTITDLWWDIRVYTTDGDFVDRRVGRLSAPELSHLEPLPIAVRRGETVSAFALASFTPRPGRRIDGEVVWTTNRGTVHVPIHVGP